MSRSISKESAATTKTRLRNAAAGKVPWISTMTPIELSLTRSHGIRPIAMVSGACRMQDDFSWTIKGWDNVLTRLRSEAKIVGANAVIDVKLQSTLIPAIKIFNYPLNCNSWDFSAVGTAVRLDGLPKSKAPLITDMPALELVRLLQLGIVPIDIAVSRVNMKLALTPGTKVKGFIWNKPQVALNKFWISVMRKGWNELGKNAGDDGTHFLAYDRPDEHMRNGSANGNHGTYILAHTHKKDLTLKPNINHSEMHYIGRQIAIGTVVDCGESAMPIPPIRPVVDMRDDESPLRLKAKHTRNTYPVSQEQEAS